MKKEANATTAPGQKLIMFSGLIFIADGFLGALAWMFTAVMANVADTFGGLLGTQDAGISAGAAVFSAAIGIFVGIVGIVGVANRAKPEKADLLIPLGVAALIAEVVQVILTQFSILGLITCFVPIVFIYGAYQNKQAKMGGKR